MLGEKSVADTRRGAFVTRLIAVLAVFGVATMGLVLAEPAAAAQDGAEISGTVTEREAPAERVLVSAYSWHGDGEGYVFEQEAETDSDGGWSLSHLPDGEYTLEFDTSHSGARYALGETLAGHRSIEDEEPQFEIRDGAAISTPYRSVRLRRSGGAVGVSVTDAHGRTLIDLDDAYAVLIGKTRGGEAWTSARFWSDEQGQIEVPRVPAGTYVPFVGAHGSDPAPIGRSVTVTAGRHEALGKQRRPESVSGTLSVVSGEPRIDGVLRVGERLESAAPHFAQDPDSIEYQWFADSEPIAGKTGPALRLGRDTAGTTISVSIVAHKKGLKPYIGQAVSESAVRPHAGSSPEPSPPAGGGDDSNAAGGSDPHGGTDGGSSRDDGGSMAGGLAATGSAISAGIAGGLALLVVGTVLYGARRESRRHGRG